jgi:putative ABC transport system permease protein
VVLVSETAARTLWPGESPLGKRISVGQGGFGAGAEIVGVVSDVRYVAIENAPRSDVYVPLAQPFQPGTRVFVRSRLDTAALMAAIRGEVRALDPALPLGEVKTMGQRLDDAVWRTRVTAWLLSAFAALALLLTAIGLFGVMAQTVVQRTAEIGIRMALGAQRRDVLALVLRRAALVTGSGLIAGVACALGVTRVIAALLYDVDAQDPFTLLSVSGLLAAVAMAACYLPARRATRHARDDRVRRFDRVDAGVDDAEADALSLDRHEIPGARRRILQHELIDLHPLEVRHERVVGPLEQR